MGYEIHITRKKYYHDEEGKAITESEWHGHIAKDPELVIDQEQGKNFAVWSGDNSHGSGNAWFDWFEGSIHTKAPDEKILDKMISIAEALDAKVQGDDGEVYFEADFENGFRREEDEPDDTDDSAGKSWFGRLFGG